MTYSANGELFHELVFAIDRARAVGADVTHEETGRIVWRADLDPQPVISDQYYTLGDLPDHYDYR